MVQFVSENPIINWKSALGSKFMGSVLPCTALDGWRLSRAIEKIQSTGKMLAMCCMYLHTNDAIYLLNDA